MQRKIYSRMKAWNDSDDRKPLMIMGPRQVGKTYSATRFARENYGSYVLQLSQIVKLYETLGFEHYNTDF